MLKYTKHNLTRLEDIFRDLNITIRYEKGSFQSGYCMVSGKNIIIINRFYDVEARMNVLLEILETTQIPTDDLSDEAREWLTKWRKSFLHPT